jgi:hypothetical protein
MGQGTEANIHGGGGDMPTLGLIAKKAVLNLQAGHAARFWDIALNILSNKENNKLALKPTFAESLMYSVALEGFSHHIRLSEGEDFSRLEGFVLLERSAAENTDKPIGLLTYSVDPSSYQVRCALPTQQFDELVLAAGMVASLAQYRWMLSERVRK